MESIHGELGRVFFKNRDGTSRQRTIERYVQPGTPLVFHMEGKDLAGDYRVGVWVKVKPILRSPRMIQIGNVDPINSKRLYRYIDEGGQVIGKVEKVTGKRGERHGVSYVTLNS